MGTTTSTTGTTGTTDWEFSFPLLKSSPDDDESRTAYTHRGVASTEEADVQGETVIQKALDFSPFWQYGVFNWDHKEGPENRIGEPTRAEITRLGAIPGYQLQKSQTPDTPCFYVEGVLYRGHARAEAVWELKKALDSGQYRRFLGYSVEGGAVKSGRRVTRSVVTDIGITDKPVNRASRMLMKSFGELVTFAKSLGETTAPTQSGTDDLTSFVLGLVPCERGCHENGRFAKGRSGMLEHLVRCAGWEPLVARDHVITIWNALH